TPNDACYHQALLSNTNNNPKMVGAISLRCGKELTSNGRSSTGRTTAIDGEKKQLPAKIDAEISPRENPDHNLEKESGSTHSTNNQKKSLDASRRRKGRIKRKSTTMSTSRLYPSQQL
ncbi:hypothetical protein Dimus_029267, partial [Dionaea muscipula]